MRNNYLIYDPAKYSVFDLIDFVQREGFEVEWNVPGKVNKKCLKWWEDNYPEHLEEVRNDKEKCRGGNNVSIRILETGGTLYVPNYDFSTLHFLLSSTVSTMMYEMRNNDEDSQYYKIEEYLFKKLKKKFEVKDNNFLPIYKVKDLDQIINHLESNNLHIGTDGNLLGGYKKLLMYRDMNEIEVKEINHLLQNEGISSNESFRKYISEKINRFDDSFSWTPTYPNWEEDIKKNPELDPRKKSFLSKLFKKD